MKITFLLPFRKNNPVGGLKIMYEYANRLAEKGHQIEILHHRKKFQKYSACVYPVARILKEIENALFGRWFKFNKACKVAYIRYINDETIPNADAIIYTWWTLGYPVEKLSPEKGIKVNLIQDYEIWAGNIDELHQSYNLDGIHNIVISEHLKKIVSQYTDKPVFHLPNAIDTSVFKITTEIEKRNPETICMLYHKEARKGCDYGMKALQLVKDKIPNLKVIFFGVYDKPDYLPEYIEYHKKPKDLSALYNRAAIYVTNSLQEGWALPPAESMACGCALICTNIGGHLGYANTDTALLVEPENPQKMADAIVELISRHNKRILLAQNGHAYIQRFQWNTMVSLLEQHLQELAK
ncbi:MAG: glycosyltransferase family 4 protein [Dysgonamonadaceae bacterium]|jgi:glycosyltransferase involved in cell wall biosynthesis|nr:glycosyltransferase family 4 protein [Dysgonamonadaceae bacterium]